MEREVSMHIEEVEKEEFAQIMRNAKNIFNKPSFSETNRDKVQEILYLVVYKEKSPRFAVTFGIKESGKAACPFSAPFAYMEPLKKNQSVRNYEEACEVLDSYFVGKGIKSATITLPPEIYDSETIHTWYMVLKNHGWEIQTIDLSFALPISAIGAEYENIIAYNAKKNLRIALKSQLTFRECSSSEDKKEAYRVIKENRASKGYPLRMSEEQVLKTMQLVPSKMFLVEAEGVACASALVYDVTDTIAQVVYWGDVPGYGDKKPINFLAYELVKYYQNKGFEYLDIGPSTEDGIPNYGLCNFKDSIGCERASKFRFYKEY